MVRLKNALDAWGTPAFEQRLKEGVEQAGDLLLPLQQGLSRGSVASDDDLSAMIIGVEEDPGQLRVKAGIHYTGVIAGCCCADDPTPVDVLAEYCVVQIDIDRETAEATATLIPD